MSTYNFSNDPFADPTITAATNQNGNPALEDYNPFANQPTSNVDPFSPTFPTPTTSAAPAVLTPSTAVQQNNVPPAPQYTQSTYSSAGTLTAEQLRQRQEELDRKAAELAAREAELQRAQRMVNREHNFPPLPSFLPCTPCFYQDINVEIEVNFQNVVRQVYQLWLFYIVVLLVNFIGCLGAMIEKVPNGGGMFTFALVTVVLFTPLSYVCWFRPLYKAFRDDSSFNFMVFFFVFFCQIVLSAVWALGLPGVGSIGLITTIGYLSGTSILFRLLCFFCTIVLSAYVLASIYLLIRVHGIYHQSDASLEKAQSEFASKLMSNERVQQMASNAAQTAARQAMNQAFTPNAPPNNQPGFRY